MTKHATYQQLRGHLAYLKLEWETDTGAKRQAIDIIAETIQFLGTGNGTAPAAEADAF